jgi:hypothetical protein
MRSCPSPEPLSPPGTQGHHISVRPRCVQLRDCAPNPVRFMGREQVDFEQVALHELPRVIASMSGVGAAALQDTQRSPWRRDIPTRPGLRRPRRRFSSPRPPQFMAREQVIFEQGASHEPPLVIVLLLLIVIPPPPQVHGPHTRPYFGKRSSHEPVSAGAVGPGTRLGRDEGRPLHASRPGSWSSYVSNFWKTHLPMNLPMRAIARVESGLLTPIAPTGWKVQHRLRAFSRAVSAINPPAPSP